MRETEKRRIKKDEGDGEEEDEGDGEEEDKEG